MCTYADCSTANESFASRADWLAHEKQVHLLVWRCKYHPSITYKSQVEFEAHMRSEHTSLTELEIEASSEYSKTIVEDERDHCRICLVTVPHLPRGQTLANHLAHHFEAFARPSLPDRGGEDDDAETEDEENVSEGGENPVLLRDGDLDDLSDVEPDVFEDAPDSVDVPSIHALAMTGNKFGMRALLDDKPNVNLEDDQGWTALQRAAHAGQSTILQMLLSAGADVNYSSGHYGNALQCAAVQGLESILRSLIDSGANIDQRGGLHGNALLAAVRHKHRSIVRILLDADVRFSLDDGLGAAIEAATIHDEGKIRQMVMQKLEGRVDDQEPPTNDSERERHQGKPLTKQEGKRSEGPIQNVSIAAPSAPTAPVIPYAAGRAVDGTEVVRDPQIRGAPPRRVSFLPAVQRGLLDPSMLFFVAIVNSSADKSRLQGARSACKVLRSRQGMLPAHRLVARH